MVKMPKTGEYIKFKNFERKIKPLFIINKRWFYFSFGSFKICVNHKL